MNYANRRQPLRRGRRIPLNVTLAPETHRELARIGEGNKSAGIEELVRQHIERRAIAEPEPA
jgi:hypothetical protein